MDKQYYIYIICDKNNNVLYTDVTSDLKKRIYEHKEKLIDGFTPHQKATAVKPWMNGFRCGIPPTQDGRNPEEKGATGVSPWGSTKKYSVNKLVYHEIFDDIECAISREKQIKGGSRQKKIDLIEGMNREWEDLYKRI